MPRGVERGLALTWTARGLAPYWTRPEPTLVCRLGSSGYEQDAFLDTGSAWSVLRTDVVADLERESAIEATGEVRALRVRGIAVSGRILRCDLELDASAGESFRIDASFMEADDEFPFSVVLGMKGCLDRLALALLPAATSRDDGAHGAILFGPAVDLPP